MAVSQVLLANRHQKPAHLQLETERQRRCRQIRLLDSDSFGIVESDEHIAAKVGVDRRLKSELDFAHAQSRSILLGAALRRELGHELADDADSGEKAGIARALRTRARRRAGVRLGALQSLELFDERERIRASDAVRPRRAVARWRRLHLGTER